VFVLDLPASAVVCRTALPPPLAGIGKPFPGRRPRVPATVAEA